MQKRLSARGPFGVLSLAAPLVGLTVCLTAQSATAIDQITPYKSSGRTPAGEITGMTPYEVTIVVGGEEQKVPVNNIRTIRFDGEPSRLTNVIRNGVFGGRYEDMLEELKTLESEENITKSYVKEEVAFLKAYCKAKLALGGGDAAAVREAGTALNAFVSNHPSSFRVLQASELVGDLMVAVAKTQPDKQVDIVGTAVQQYDKLSQAPWPDYQMRGALKKGHAWQSAEETDKALAEFEKVLAIDGGEGTESLTLEATLGKAECQAKQGGVDEAIQLVMNVVRDADPENSALHAQAYHTLGNCYRSSDDPKNAMLAYLHVHLLYRVDPQLHRSALGNLIDVYNQMGDSKNALRIQQLLEATYGGR